MVSTNIQGLVLSDELGDELLRHLKVEMCDVAMGMSSGTATPIHTDTLLTLMLELLPYENSDKPGFSEGRFHSFLSELNDEIIEDAQADSRRAKRAGRPWGVLKLRICKLDLQKNPVTA
jgi:hypothetical protein